MNKTILIAAAAALTVLSGTTSFTSTAEAGGGVRLGFGLPIGSFTARPTRGGYAASGYSKKAACKKKGSNYAAKKATSSRKAKTVASRSIKPSPKKSTSVAAYSKPKTSHKVDRTNRNETNEEITTGSTGSSALIQGDSQAEQTTVEVPAELPAVDVETEVAAATTENAAAPAQPVTGTTTTETAVESTSTGVVGEEPTKVEEPKTEPAKQAKTDPEDCKKYIPSIGVTISVGC